MGRVTTANRGYDVPDLDAAANIPADFLTLANGVDANVAALYAGTATPTHHASATFSVSAAHGIGTDAAGWTVEEDASSMSQADGFHVPVAGVYMITAQSSTPVNANGFRSIGIRVAGTLRGTVNSDAVSSTATELDRSLAYRMAAGSIATVRLYQNSGSTLTVTGRVTVTYLHP